MAKNETTTSARAAEIASKIHTACSAIGATHRDMMDHQEQVQDLSAQLNGIGGSRLAIATEIAAMALSENWTMSEVVQGCALAGKMGNSQDSTSKTIGVFISEMKTFAHPKVRENFPVILAACQDAWQAEQDALACVDSAEDRKAIDTPVKKYKSRIYHLVTDIARQVKADKLTVAGAQDVVAWAVANDPDHDEDKIKGRLDALVGQVDAIFADFGLEELKVAADYLRTVTAKELLEARKVMLAGVTPPAQPARPEVVADVPKAAQDVSSGADVSVAESVIEGVADLDDLMNDNVQAALLAA
jgi:hypothetical protein